jgi:hypothetical protein
MKASPIPNGSFDADYPFHETGKPSPQLQVRAIGGSSLLPVIASICSTAVANLHVFGHALAKWCH